MPSKYLKHPRPHHSSVQRHFQPQGRKVATVKYQNMKNILVFTSVKGAQASRGRCMVTNILQTLMVPHVKLSIGE